MFHGLAENVLNQRALASARGKVDLIFTSPPFPLRTKKRYGNETGEAFIRWLSSFGQTLANLLSPTGSFLIEMGNAWEAGRPVMSTLGLRALLALVDSTDLLLCQEFIINNTARLPGPAQWVNIERIRVKDSFTRVWWLSRTPRPKADNRRVLAEYSPAMRKLLRTGRYTAGLRPSQHVIGERSFNRDNGGAIPSNVLSASNTLNHDRYLDYCKLHGYRPHPARMPLAVPNFFIQFLTDPGDLILDPFAGSNTTGYVAETLNRRWIGIEAQAESVEASRGRFDARELK